MFYDVIPKRALLLFSKEYIIIWPNPNVVYVQGTTGSTCLACLDQLNKNIQSDSFWGTVYSKTYICEHQNYNISNNK